MPVLPAWQIKQKVTRELQYCEKALQPLSLAFATIKSDDPNVTFSELQGLAKKLDARLAMDVRWVYMGEDLEGCESADSESQKNVRTDKLHQMKNALSKLQILSPILRSYHAKSEEDEAFGVASYRACMEDAWQDGEDVHIVFAKKYAERAVRVAGEEALEKFRRAWEESAMFIPTAYRRRSFAVWGLPEVHFPGGREIKR